MWRSFVGAFVIGLFTLALADLAQVIAREPTLLGASRLGAVVALGVSSLLLYLLVGLIILPTALILYGTMRLFRAGVRGSALALASFFFFGLFFVILSPIQEKMLGTYTSVRDPIFVLTVVIAGGISLACVILWAWAARHRLGVGPLGRGRLCPALVLLVFFVIYGLVFSGPINVLGVFDREKKRTLTREHPPDTTIASVEHLPDIVVITIECFRYDHFTSETAPFLWELARKNVLFSRYYVVAPATRPSVTSFFTSLYPVEHGCYNLAGGKTAAGIPMLRRVPKAAVSFPRLLQNRGYRTIMVSSNSLTADVNFGFEHVYQKFDAAAPYKFDIPYIEPFLAFRFLRYHLDSFRFFKMIAFAPDHSTTYFDARRLEGTIQEELERRDDRPLFMYIHYMEPHAPYYRHPYRPFQLNVYLPAFKDYILGNYVSEIRAVDEVIRELFAYMEGGRLSEDAILFITSDHGEEFYDHGHWGHGKSVYPEVLHVPAILVAKHQGFEALRIDVPLESIDIAPTLMELAGLESSPSWEGRSLVPLLSSVARDSSLETEGWDRVAMAQFDDGQKLLATALDDSFQLVMRKGGGGRSSFFLFDLRKDPLAKIDLSGQGLKSEQELRAFLEKKLEQCFARGELLQSSEEEMDEDLIEQLRALGYIQ